MADTPNQQSPGLLANILAVAGFIILIVIIVWGAYHLLRLMGSGVSSLFSGLNKNDAIVLTAPTAPVGAGKAFNLSWKYSPSEAGTYAFLYQCKSGFRFDATNPAGQTGSIPCGNAFTIGSVSSLSLTPIVSGTSTIDVPISIVFMPSATSTTSRPQGTALVHVVGGSGSAPTSPVTTNTGSNSSGPTYGTVTKPVKTSAADLSVKILAIGVIDPITGVFVARPAMNPNEIAAVKFDIGNTGGTSTGVWYFTVQLPTSPMYTYQSPAQMSLAPGAHIENTLRFRPVAMNGGMINVMVDPQGMVRDAYRGNNNASLWMNGGSWNYNQYPYQAPYVY